MWDILRSEVIKNAALSKFTGVANAKQALVMTYPAQLWMSYGPTGHHAPG